MRYVRSWGISFAKSAMKPQLKHEKVSRARKSVPKTHDFVHKDCSILVSGDPHSKA